MSCNKNHNAERCWWIHPEFRPNNHTSTVSKLGVEFDNIDQKLNKVTIAQDSNYRSLMKCHHDFIVQKILQELNSEIQVY